MKSTSPRSIPTNSPGCAAARSAIFFRRNNVIPVMTALENVTLPMVFAGLGADEARDKGVSLLTRVGLGRTHPSQAV